MCSISAKLAAILALLTSGCVRHYPVDGIVLGVNRNTNTILVSHREIPRYMPPMAMEFNVGNAASLATLGAGDHVRFDLQVSRNRVLAANLHRQQADIPGVVIPPAPDKVANGQLVPDFTLIDQTDQPLKLSDLRGRVVVVDFIYTRCPMPNVCPRLSGNFAYLHRKLSDRFPHDLALLSITLDPQYDRPPILAEYAQRWGSLNGDWRFLTGSIPEITKVAGYFGLIYWPEEGVITHTSATAVIGRDGRLEGRIEGSSYRPEQLRDLVLRSLLH